MINVGWKCRGTSPAGTDFNLMLLAFPSRHNIDEDSLWRNIIGYKVARILMESREPAVHPGGRHRQ